MSNNRLFLGIGANLVPDGFQSVREGCEAAIALMPALGIDVEKVSPWYETAPVPVSDQPWFVNAVIAARSAMPAASVLAALHQIEAKFGRTRSVRNEARVLDIDLLDYDGQLLEEGGLQYRTQGLTSVRLYYFRYATCRQTGFILNLAKL